ncbi:c-type cytochrome [Methylobacterium radiodurans]|uniref:Cytochrome C n=1 Tax=Methylobacterium radiodurans TaxID=2202828 RepID=A0A2U8VSS9_9HYPH|nr:cytochrome c family protein [Methylobacterium radiodurans]AWN36849.1 cytochrome C [Methylobacterium radiodurans]
MDSFELNKVAGAVLGAVLFAVGSGFVAELIYHPKPAGKAGYDLPEPPPESGAPAEAAKVEPIAVRLASANVEKGQGGTKACQACHSFEKGGPNKVGPDLWEIVERAKGGHGGFEYSAGLKEKGGTWTYDDLDHFLASPKGFIKGTKMAFAGISSPQERANVIAYLRTLSDSPKPLPAADKAEAKPADTKAAEGGKPAEAKPADKPAETKPSASQPAAGKASEGKDSPAKPADTNTAEPVLEKAPGSPKPNTATPNRNEPERKPDPAAGGPSPSAPIEAAPATPPEPAAKEPPAKADPAAEDKGKTLREQGSTGGEAGK